MQIAGNAALNGLAMSITQVESADSVDGLLRRTEKLWADDGYEFRRATVAGWRSNSRPSSSRLPPGKSRSSRSPLSQGKGILLRPCNLVHTLGMHYPIDVVFLRRDGLVLKVAPAVVPRRACGYLRGHCVLELAAGEAARCALVPGMTLPTNLP